jgi:hypothetical protein
MGLMGLMGLMALIALIALIILMTEVASPWVSPCGRISRSAEQ